jgi:hypothetical protein
MLLPLALLLPAAAAAAAPNALPIGMLQAASGQPITFCVQ